MLVDPVALCQSQDLGPCSHHFWNIKLLGSDYKFRLEKNYNQQKATELQNSRDSNLDNDILYFSYRIYNMMLRWMCLLAVVAVAKCELLAYTKTRLSSYELNFEEITQVMSDGDPSGKNHSIRVTISEHAPLESIVEWKFHMHLLEGRFLTYNTKADGETPSTQTEFIFEGNLEDSDSIALQAKNSSEDIAMAYLVLDIKELKSKVAWVGENRESSSSSIRVIADERVGDVRVNEHVCTPSESPCYYITPETKPSSFVRCVNHTKDYRVLIKQCDERVTLYKGMQAPPPISLTDDGSLEIEFTHRGILFKVEVVVYDIDNSTKVFSSYPYKCRFPIGVYWEEGDKKKCRHDLTLPEDLTEMMVLIVITDENGDVVESTLEYFDATANKKLSLEKISKVLRDDDPSGESHNTKVTMSHKSLSNIIQWKLTLHKNDRTPITYTVDADGSNPLSQTEIVFEGNLVESSAIALQAWNSTTVAALDYLILAIEDMDSSVAWVGGEKDSSSASLRVATGKNFNEIEFGSQNCQRDFSPCYYLTPDSAITAVERCKNLYIGGKRTVQLCDERVVAFSETSPKPSVSLREDGNLEVEFNLMDGETFDAEVVAYDNDDHGRIFTDSGYRCLTPVGVEPYIADKKTCLHKVSLPEGQTKFTVLVVKSDEAGNVITSTLVHVGEDEPMPENAGLIIGIVIGTILGVALIAFLIVFLLKKKKKTASISGSTTHKYEAAPKEERKESYTEKTIEEGKEDTSS